VAHDLLVQDQKLLLDLVSLLYLSLLEHGLSMTLSKIRQIHPWPTMYLADLGHCWSIRETLVCGVSSDQLRIEQLGLH
jgi:hypothetical protein